MGRPTPTVPIEGHPRPLGQQTLRPTYKSRHANLPPSGRNGLSYCVLVGVVTGSGLLAETGSFPLTISFSRPRASWR